MGYREGASGKGSASFCCIAGNKAFKQNFLPSILIAAMPAT
jgi:hypothetical protein